MQQDANKCNTNIRSNKKHLLSSQDSRAHLDRQPIDEHYQSVVKWQLNKLTVVELCIFLYEYSK